MVVGFVPSRVLKSLIQESTMSQQDCKAAEIGRTNLDLKDIDVMALADPAPMQVDEETGVDTIMDIFIALGLRFVLVTARGRPCYSILSR